MESNKKAHDPIQTKGSQGLLENDSCFQKWKRENIWKIMDSQVMRLNQFSDWNFDDEEYNYSFSFFFDDEYVRKFLNIVTKLPVFVHYVQVTQQQSVDN